MTIKPTLLGIPLDDHSSFMKGAAQAPPLMREALHSYSTNLWSESKIDFGGAQALLDEGDIVFDSTEDAFLKIEKAVSDLLAKDRVPIILGGDHSITYPIIRAFRKTYPKLNILQFDAHPDLYDELEGDRMSHACPFARIMEENLVDRLVQVGIRTMNGYQLEQAEKFGVEVYEMRQFDENFNLTFDAPLYISFDLDALDPAFAPGVSHFEPGGFSTRQAIQIIQKLNAPGIVGCDLVEFNPERDRTGMTAMVCAKLVKEIGSRILTG